jgi:hypothetical protein
MSVRTSAVTIFLAAAALFTLLAKRPYAPDSPVAEAKNDPTAATPPNAAATPVLVELFTSEGCSSCPPADALLSRLGKTQPVPGARIIVLEEHVDYWDNLGWKDPFSSAAATARQSEYGQAFGGEQVYTPQMVVDGHAEFVGSSESNALRAIRDASHAAKPAIQLDWGKDDTLSIHIESLTNSAPRQNTQLFLAVAEDLLHSDVKHGENSGRALEHNGVVRHLLPLAKIPAAGTAFSTTVPVDAAREWNRSNLHAVVFVQNPRTRQVLAAASIPFRS